MVPPIMTITNTSKKTKQFSKLKIDNIIGFQILTSCNVLL